MMQVWFESKVKYVKVSESGNEQLITENFLLDAVSYTDAETRIISKMQQMVKNGEFTIVDIKKSRIAEVFPYQSGEWWFKATINLVTVDEEAGREKKVRNYYLIMADDIQEALTRLDESLSFFVVPYLVTSIAVSTIVDVFPYEPSETVIPNN
ncbi:MAG: phage tail protein [Draconibacterium sp.]|nr:MAG: phage tail protein [Draconibacterium sp.]